MTAFIPYQVHSAEILQASAGKYNVFFFFKAKGIITVMTLGLKKPDIDYHFSFKVQSLVT